MLIALLTQGPANAQVLYGSVVGTVTDPSDAPLPGATITVTQKETGLSRTVVTSDLGAYSVPNLPAGTYEVGVSKSGFQTYTRSDVHVAINSIARVDVTPALGAVAETVTVVAGAAVLQADRAEVRAEVAGQTLENLPMPPGRNYQHILATVPGFTQPRTAHSIPSNPSRSLMFEANGAVAGGAAINVQIKSGTNELHGSAFWFHNNSSAAPLGGPSSATSCFTSPATREPRLASSRPACTPSPRC